MNIDNKYNNFIINLLYYFILNWIEYLKFKFKKIFLILLIYMNFYLNIFAKFYILLKILLKILK